jgi:hypothetical protein
MRTMFSGLLRSWGPALAMAVIVGVVGVTGTAYAGKSGDHKSSGVEKSWGGHKSSQGDKGTSHDNDGQGNWNGEDNAGYKHHKHHRVAPGGGFVNVDDDTPGISYSNSSVRLTNAGVVFGPYTDNNHGGSVKIDVPAGTTLADIAQLEYSASFTENTPHGDGPYLRVFIDDNGDGFCPGGVCGTDDHDVVFSPSTQPGGCAAYGATDALVSPVPPHSIQCNSAGRLIHYVVTDGTVRYDDDPGTGPDSRWGEVVNAHGADKVESIRVSAGFSLPDTTGAKLTSLFYELAGQSPTTLAFVG